MSQWFDCCESFAAVEWYVVMQNWVLFLKVLLRVLVEFYWVLCVTSCVLVLFLCFVYDFTVSGGIS